MGAPGRRRRRMSAGAGHFARKILVLHETAGRLDAGQFDLPGYANPARQGPGRA